MVVSVRAIVIGFAVAALAAVPGELIAQPESAGRLTLERALELARLHNPDLRKAVHEVERSAAAERSRWGTFLPAIAADGSLSDFSSRTLTGTDPYGQPVQLPEATSVSAASASATVGLSLTLFSGFRGVNELRSARAGRRAADALHAAEVVRIEAEVSRRFYDALGEARLVGVEERLYAAAADRLEAMRAMEAAGRATPQDVLGANADLARQEMALDAARHSAYAARLLLGELMGTGAADIGLAGEFPDLFDPARLSESDVVQWALRSNPRVARAEARAAQAAHAAGAAAAGRWPAVRLSMGVDRGLALPDRSLITDYPWNRGFGVRLSASVPIFSGFAITEQIVRARTAEADADEDLRGQRVAVEREARSAWSAASAAYRGVHFAELAAELELHRMETAQEGFRRGLLGFTELQQLIDRAALAERTAVRAWMNFARAIATLAEVVGGADFDGDSH